MRPFRPTVLLGVAVQGSALLVCLVSVAIAMMIAARAASQGDAVTAVLSGPIISFFSHISGACIANIHNTVKDVLSRDNGRDDEPRNAKEE